MRTEIILFTVILTGILSAVSGVELGNENFRVRIAVPEEMLSLEKEYRPRFDLCGTPCGIRIGGREYLIPAVPGAFIQSVDLDADRMEVHVWEGMDGDEN